MLVNVSYRTDLLKTSYILWGPLLIWIQEPPECLLTILLYYVIFIYYLKCLLTTLLYYVTFKYYLKAHRKVYIPILLFQGEH